MKHGTAVRPCRMTTADLVFGLIARVAQLRHEVGKDDPVRESVFVNRLHDFAMDGFHREFASVDFDRIGGNSFSRALDEMFSQATTWGIFARSDGGALWMRPLRAEEWLQELRWKYGVGSPPMKRLEALAEALHRQLI